MVEYVAGLEVSRAPYTKEIVDRDCQGIAIDVVPEDL